ncbi:hypothetical protein SAMN05216499_1498 [Actinacidiphila paucisporea]|uniref:Uncharacterized protein n=1 Tax=Actinacidiphila paucisporea TaxID=310782 RepID=A0A1M7QYC5_9ACTN|nr:hypothetical protein SAMN05216499_1498 [Actinacidiphila paucisporea]
MVHTTGPAPVDVTTIIPGLRPWRRTSVRLHPRRGTPAPESSHVGGAIQTSARMEWPSCPDHSYVNTAGNFQPLPMLAVGQFLCKDFPEILFPENADLLQVFWCPNDHFLEFPPSAEYEGPRVELRWLDSSHVDGFSSLTWEASWPVEDSYLVHPCTIDQERVDEYPDSEVLPPLLAEAADAISTEDGGYQYSLSVARGWKIGGWPSWHLTGLQHIECPDCAGPVKLLIKVDSCEWDGGSDRWWPLEERSLTEEQEPAAREPTGTVVGRFGELRIFTCESNPAHSPIPNIQ